MTTVFSESDCQPFEFVFTADSDQLWRRTIAQRARSWAQRHPRIDDEEELLDQLCDACGFIADDEESLAITTAKAEWDRIESEAENRLHAEQRLAAKNAKKAKRLTSSVEKFNSGLWVPIVAHMVLREGTWDDRVGQAEKLLEKEKEPIQLVLSSVKLNPCQSDEANKSLALDWLGEVIEIYQPQFKPASGTDDSGAAIEKEGAGKADMAFEAKAMLHSLSIDGFPRLRYWSGSFWTWTLGRFVETSIGEIRAAIVNHLNERYTGVGVSHVSNMVEQLKAQCILSSQIPLQSWLAKHPWDIEDIVPTQNAIIHLPSFVSSDDNADFWQDATPALFTTSSVRYKISHHGRPPCTQWLRFLESIWPGDQESISTLQEWFGYCLTPDTRQQKMLFMIGKKRSGKGTVARTLTSVVGEQNVAGPTFASLAGEFGLQPLLGKTVAIINDARLSGRTDQAVITERLLSISGEDTLTVSRKHLESVDTKLRSRLMIISNELPRLQDQSGALTGRMIVLQLSESFYGREDKDLSEKLKDEREGILYWAIDGWRRLRERGHFLQPTSSADMCEQMDELASPVSAFVRDMCETGCNFSVPTKDLYSTWSEWCKDFGSEAGNPAGFGRDLTAATGVKSKQRRLGAHRTRVYEGIRLRQ